MFKSSDIVAIIKDQNNAMFDLSWKLTSWCNYNCSYCSQETRQKKFNSQPILEARAKNIDKIINQLSNKKAIQLSLIGGEITYYNLIDILKNINLSKIFKIRLTTNFSQDNNYFIELLDFLYKQNNNLKITLTLSFHDEYIPLSSFLNKVVKLHESIQTKYNNKSKVKLNVSLVINNELDCTLLKQFITNYPKLTICPNIQRDINGKIVDLDKEHMEFKTNLTTKENFKTNKILLILKSNKHIYFSDTSTILNNIDEKVFISKGYLCSAGLNNLRIDENGNIRRGQCPLELSKNIVGNIDNDKNIILPTEPIKCSFENSSIKSGCILCPWVNIKIDTEEGIKP